jgi:hypothetical protein
MSFLKTVSKPTSIVSLLIGGMTAYDKHRGVDTIHASDLTKDEEFCPREYTLLSVLGKAKKGFAINAALRYTFDMGRDIEARIQNDYLRDFAVGDWRCTSCGQLRQFQKVPKAGCDREDIQCNWRYSEVRLILPPVTCGYDLLLDVGKKKLRVIEIKTMIKDQFKALIAPLAEHRLRTNLYLRMVDESPLSDRVESDVGHILYVAKSYGTWNEEAGTISPFKEYEVQRDNEQTDELMAKTVAYKKYQDDGWVPKGVCPSGNCKRAKACGVAKECFSGKYKAGAII